MLYKWIIIKILFLPDTETTGKVTMMITPVTRSTIQGTVIVITTGAVGIALALILHHVSTVIVEYIAPILHCRCALEVTSPKTDNV